MHSKTYFLLIIFFFKTDIKKLKLHQIIVSLNTKEFVKIYEGQLPGQSIKNKIN